ncbi:MAG: cyclic nucleotide-binding domain-containing protein [Chloroflexi bacterium]|nr:cyclic nucleotide-binding domain-containing protein [Chloroflexota bacterium]
MELTSLLHQVELFHRCNGQQIQAIASVCKEHFLEQGALVCRQSYLGATLYLIESGEALVRRINEQGEDRPVKVLHAGEVIGITSLFIGEPRDASVVAVSDLHLFTIRREDFNALLERNPDLWRALTIPSEIVYKLRTPTVEWLESDETLVYLTHRHWLVPARPIALVSLVYILLSVFLFVQASSAETFPAYWVPVSGLYLLILIWLWLDWRNDYFAVTTRRVVHQERMLFLFEAREEAPIDRVQDIQIEKGFAASAFNYGDLIIETAAVAGVLRFSRIPQPEKMREVIFNQTTRMLAVSRAAHRLQIQDELASRLGQRYPNPTSMPVPEYPFALPDVNALQFSRKGLARFIEKLGTWGLVPRTTVVTREGVTWRKHWVFLISKAIFPFLLAGVCGAATLVALLNSPVWLGDFTPYFPYLSAALLVITYGWFFWRINDWANDLYIVTDDRIIDIERHPLFLSESRREASLGVIQNVAFKQGNLIAKVFNYGDVVVQTAGPGTFTFMHVPNPRNVQREVFKRMEAFRRNSREHEASALRGEMSEWFGIYDQMHSNDSNG